MITKEPLNMKKIAYSGAGVIALLLVLVVCFFRPFGVNEKVDVDAGSLAEQPIDQFKTLFQYRFNKPRSIKAWKEKVFKGKGTFEVVTDEASGEKVLKSASDGTSSGIFKKVKVEMKDNPVLRWEWKVTQFPSNKKNKVFAAKTDNDYGARIYAIFDGATIFTSDIIQYVWDDHFAEGTYARSPYTDRVKTFVVRNDKKGDSATWFTETRDIVKDYEMLYGKKPKRKLVAIGIMSDSDNTKTQSEAYIKSVSVLTPVN